MKFLNLVLLSATLLGTVSAYPNIASAEQRAEQRQDYRQDKRTEQRQE